MGAKQRDGLRTADIFNRVGMSFVNKAVVKSSATMAWKAARTGLADHLITEPDSRTWAASCGLLRPGVNRMTSFEAKLFHAKDMIIKSPFA